MTKENLFQFFFSLHRLIVVKHLMKILFQQPCLHMLFNHLVRLEYSISFLFCYFIFQDSNPSSAGDNSNKGKYPSRYPSISDSIFEYLCRSVDNDYIAHPTDCKRYAYCANGKKRDISSSFIPNKRRVDIESIDQMLILSCLHSNN
jgi:hypothetical protein